MDKKTLEEYFKCVNKMFDEYIHLIAFVEKKHLEKEFNRFMEAENR